MPRVTNHEDGSKSFTVNSNELRALKNLVHEHVPASEKMLRIVDGPEVRAALDFVKSVVT